MGFHERLKDEIIQINPPNLPFSCDAKIFNTTDDEGEIIGEPYSYNDFIKEIEDIWGVNEDLLGKRQRNEK